MTADIVGLMEQTDGDGDNHNVVAVLPGDTLPDLEVVREQLTELHHRGLPRPPRATSPRQDACLPVADAMAYLAACTPGGS